jgi:hypothetical protein
MDRNGISLDFIAYATIFESKALTYVATCHSNVYDIIQAKSTGKRAEKLAFNEFHIFGLFVSRVR